MYNGALFGNNTNSNNRFNKVFKTKERNMYLVKSFNLESSIYFENDSFVSVFEKNNKTAIEKYFYNGG